MNKLSRRNCELASSTCTQVSWNFLGSGENFLGSDENFLGSDENFHGSDENFPGSKENFLGSDENFLGSDENFVGSDENAPTSKLSRRKGWGQAPGKLLHVVGAHLVVKWNEFHLMECSRQMNIF